jgi:hypothetical protein
MDETQRRAARVLRLRDGNERWGYGMGAEVGAGSAARRGRRRRSEVWCGVVWERWEVRGRREARDWALGLTRLMWTLKVGYSQRSD